MHLYPTQNKILTHLRRFLHSLHIPTHTHTHTHTPTHIYSVTHTHTHAHKRGATSKNSPKKLQLPRISPEKFPLERGKGMFFNVIC